MLCVDKQEPTPQVKQQGKNTKGWTGFAKLVKSLQTTYKVLTKMELVHSCTSQNLKGDQGGVKIHLLKACLIPKSALNVSLNISN